jgi:hypothetical protein
MRIDIVGIAFLGFKLVIRNKYLLLLLIPVKTFQLGHWAKS